MMRVLPYRTVDNVIAGVVVTFVDITRIVQAEERIDSLSHALRNRVEALETLLDLVPAGIFIAEEGPDAQIRANRHAVELAGGSTTGEKLVPMRAALPLVVNGAKVDAQDQPLATAMRTGKPVPEFEARIERADGSRVDVMMSANPLFDESGRVRGAIGALVDVSRHKEAERAQERLLHELQHRVKNILATITALTARMMRSSHSLTDFSTGFQDRLQAMARTHEVLSRSDGDGADLGGLLHATLLPYMGKKRRNMIIEGPSFQLNPSAAASLGMVFFELATNAAKYGALTDQKGRVEITWHIEEPDTLSILWKELDGPAVEEPTTKSFGTTFIQQSLEYELGGSVDLRFKKSGLECLLQIPTHKARPAGYLSTARGDDG